jgi:DNA-binding response OmpR family regulator
MRNRLLLIDDDPLVHEVAGTYLEAAGYVVFKAHTGSDGLAIARLKAPSLIVLDLGLPDVSGRHVCAEIRRRSDTPILMLTANDSVDDLISGLSEGADDYMSKPYSPRELVARVGALLRRTGEAPLGSVMHFDDGSVVVDTVRHEVTRDGVVVNLTPSEYRLVLALAQFPGRAYSRAELLHRIQGDDFEGYERTVDAHVTNVRRKLERDPAQPRYIQTVRGVGYRLGLDPK